MGGKSEKIQWVKSDGYFVPLLLLKSRGHTQWPERGLYRLRTPNWQTASKQSHTARNWILPNFEWAGGSRCIPPEPPERRTSLPIPWCLSPKTLNQETSQAHWNFWLTETNMINGYCLKPPSLWSFVMAAEKQVPASRYSIWFSLGNWTAVISFIIFYFLFSPVFHFPNFPSLL